MDRELIWNTEVTKIQHTNYVRNSRAITVAWFVFCACYTILNVIAFIQPFWFGDTNESPGVGYFGLYEWCERVQGSDYSCAGDFLDFNTILNNYFRASSFLVGSAALLFIFSIICMLFFLFLKPERVLRVCGLLQLIAAIFMAVACIIFPNGFEDDHVKRICGGDTRAYNMDKCQIRWAYILAIVLIFDALILSVLAFVLAARQAKAIPEFEKKQPGQAYVNNGFTGSLKSGLVTTPSAQVTAAPTPVRQLSVRQRHHHQPLESETPQLAGLTQPLVIPVENFEDAYSNQSNPTIPKINTNFADSPKLETRPMVNSDSEPAGTGSNRSSPASSVRQRSSPQPTFNIENEDGSIRSRTSDSVILPESENLSPRSEESRSDVMLFDTPREEDTPRSDEEEVEVMHF